MALETETIELKIVSTFDPTGIDVASSLQQVVPYRCGFARAR
jgi:hypothetical protein